MITIKNKLNQPIVVNVTKEKAVHFLAKDQKQLTEEEFNSKEVQNHVELGNFVVLRME